MMVLECTKKGCKGKSFTLETTGGYSFDKISTLGSKVGVYGKIIASCKKCKALYSIDLGSD